MIGLERMAEITAPAASKIVLLVIDGLGGLPHPETGKTELETAHTPNLDALAREGLCGLIDPVSPGVTPGSAPGHLALFGYDPLKYEIGRGVLEALGIDFDLRPEDVAARGNFCTLDGQGRITDRRAGRLSTEENARLCLALAKIKLDRVQLFVMPVKEHRLVAVFRGGGLEPEVADTDPQRLGVPPLEAVALSEPAQRMAGVANSFIAQAREVLRDAHPANMVLLRGFSRIPRLPQFGQVFKLKAAAIAAYPMYRGLAKTVGMTILPTGPTLAEEFDTLAQHYAEYDFFFLHIKPTDTAGEDGDFEGKVKVLEEVDALVPRLMELSPEVLIVTGDHSTPALLKSHSWHPVPFLLRSRWCRSSGVDSFSESACRGGELGRFRGVAVMSLALAHAQRLTKYGA
ncbi:MAG TPA: 2,3-bisphosphoglycerate-independent phosphoglycerate mutase [Dehalococcoidia bacterium]|jgi:2,3-bisphosphoglycerate-independent phosphoglycerate mutase|nr:2,3-bisphosphoglycerate-independent phosphoglycerate mutase [Dehalococcoidia bacterium]